MKFTGQACVFRMEQWPIQAPYILPAGAISTKLAASAIGYLSWCQFLTSRLHGACFEEIWHTTAKHADR